MVMTTAGGLSSASTDAAFDEFVADARGRLRRALIGAVGIDRADDAVAEAVAWAFEHRDELAEMGNPLGYLYRVGQSRVRRRRSPVARLRLLHDESTQIPDVEPGLVAALSSLSPSQRTAVWLAHGCQWSHAEIGTAMDISPSTVATHVRRGLEHLRNELGVTS